MWWWVMFAIIWLVLAVASMFADADLTLTLLLTLLFFVCFGAAEILHVLSTHNGDGE